jgi:hypothetical protein
VSFCPPKSGAVCSKSEIRYEGTLFAIDTKDSTVTLQNGASNACVVTARYLAPASQPPVPCEPAHTDRELAHTDRDVLSRRWQFAVPTVRSFGTEDRPAPSKIAASTEVYEYIIFRGSDIKDLQVRLPRPASGMVAPAALSPDSSPPPPCLPRLLQVFENPTGGEEPPTAQVPPAPAPAPAPAAPYMTFSDRVKDGGKENTSASDITTSADGASAPFPWCLVDYVNPLTPSWRWKQGTYWLFAVFVWAYLWPFFETARELSAGWMAAIVLRNLAVELVWYGGYHYLLYVRLVAPTEAKFNPKFPKAQQHRTDMFWTTIGFLINSAVEIGMLRLWATGRIPLLDPVQHPWWCLLWIPLVPMTQDVHFFFNHRMLHFKPLYKWVHCKYQRSIGMATKRH